MNYQGNFLEDATVYIAFNTFDSNDPSASATITNLVQGDVEIWKNGVVQTTPGAGVTLTLNIGTGNGTHLIAVDTSNTTDGGFYVIGADYQVRINGTTIDGATINAWVGTFSIENRFKEVDLTQIGGQSISGNNATLKLKQLDITNNAGTAVVCKSTGSNGLGMDIAGNGTGVGLKATGGATGHGIDGQGGASGGQGLNAKANGGNGAGVLFQGKGSGEGLDARGDLTGHGISGLGGVTSGAGIYGQARAGNDAGMELVKHGSGKDLDADELLTAVQAENAVLDAVLTASDHNVANSLGKRIRQLAHVAVIREEEEAQGATANTITLNAAASAENGFYDDMQVVIVGGTGIEQARHIHAYNGTSQVADITPDWITEPVSGTKYVIRADSEVHVHEIDTDAVNAAALASDAVDKIWAKAMQDLGAIPGATASALDALNILFMALRNKQTATDGAQTLRNNAGATIATATLSDAAGTTTKEKYA